METKETNYQGFLLAVLISGILILVLIFIFLSFKPSGKITSNSGSFYPAQKPIVAPFETITITNTGFSPSQISMKLFKYGNLVHFVNKTTSFIQVIPVGKSPEIFGPLAPGKTAISLPILKAGIYEFSLKSDQAKTVKIVIQ